MTARDFSVMPVRVLPDERVSLARAVRSTGSTRPGDLVEIEFGATWATVAGRQERVNGSWAKCRIVRTEHSELVVELLQPLRLERG